MVLTKRDGDETTGPQKNEEDSPNTPRGPPVKNGLVRHSPQIGMTVIPPQNHARPVLQVHIPPWAILGHQRSLSGPLRAFAD